MDTKHLDIITTSLEALLQRGTSPKNVSRDNAAIEAFCGLVSKEPSCIPVAAKLIVSKMQSMQEWEALQALQLLEACMQSCGAQFHAEVGKFRFLNELIKLISPKYLGNLTPDAVRTEIIELLYLWTLEYPRESKIKEAYEMLKKQRVVQADPSIVNRRPPPPKPLPPPPPSQSSSSRPHTSCSILEDANQAKLLQKLLQSKRPEDLQAANKLIRSMVSEEEKKMEERSKVMLEMDAIKNNVSLLNEMLDHYSGTTSDWELIRELYTTCEEFQSSLVTKVQHLPTGDDDLLQLVISSNESLSEVLTKYKATLTALQTEETNTPLLDVNSARPSPQHSLPNTSGHMNDLVDLIPQAPSLPPPSSLFSNSNHMDLLHDLLNAGTPDSALLSFTTNENASTTVSTNQEASNNTDSALLNFSTNGNTISVASTNRRPCNDVTPSHFDSLTATKIPPNQKPLSHEDKISQKEDAVSNSPAHLPTKVPASQPLDALLGSSSLLDDTVVTGLPHSFSQPSQQFDLISDAPTLNIQRPDAETSQMSSILDLTSQLSSVESMRTNPITSVESLRTNQLTSVESLRNPTQASHQTLISQHRSAISQNQNFPDASFLPRVISPRGNSPTTMNKLQALRDLDEMVGRSLNRLGLNDEGRKDGDGSENSHAGNCPVGKNVESREISDVSGMTNGFDGGQGVSGQRSLSNGDSGDGTRHFKSEIYSGGHVKSGRSEIGKGDSTTHQEDDEQLLLDDFTLEEAPVSSEVGKVEDRPEPKPPSSSSFDTKLSDIQISLSEIQPSRVESICALDVNNIKILLHLTRTRPKPNVSVFVVTTMSGHTGPLSGYLFQPVIPKGYKFKLQPPSSTSLPPFNPFLPSPAITQIMLIASPLPPVEKKISLKFVVSYEVEGENVTEMGEIAELPLSAA